MNNAILERLLLREEDDHPEIPQGHSVNGHMFAIGMRNWNTAEPFPMNEVRRYVRLNEWKTADFNPRAELIVTHMFPRWFLMVYMMMKEFKASSRNELLSVQDAFARMMGYPIESPTDKAFCVYEYAMQTYYEGEQQ